MCQSSCVGEQPVVEILHALFLSSSLFRDVIYNHENPVVASLPLFFM